LLARLYEPLVNHLGLVNMVLLQIASVLTLFWLTKNFFL
jgi:hypothetical protein